jgi:hypothetical protein
MLKATAHDNNELHREAATINFVIKQTVCIIAIAGALILKRRNERCCRLARSPLALARLSAPTTPKLGH